MSEEKKDGTDWLEAAEVTLIGAWDALGRLGPKLIREVKTARGQRDHYIKNFDWVSGHLEELLEALSHISDPEHNLSGVNPGPEKDALEAIYKRILADRAPKKKEPSLECPRRAESGKNFPGPDFWQGDDSCSYCGSLSPDILMARIEKGDVELGPTDKSYKVYVKNVGGEKFKMWHTRTCPDVMTCDRKTCAHWTKDERDQTKFYFQHLSGDQQARLVALYNEKKLKFGEPGGFYVMPFFMRKIA